MKIAVLDDYVETLRGLPSFGELAGHNVTLFTDHVEDTDALATRLAQTEALVLFRERTTITADLVARLPNLRLISLRGHYPPVDACTERGILVCSNMHAA